MGHAARNDAAHSPAVASDGGVHVPALDMKSPAVAMGAGVTQPGRVRSVQCRVTGSNPVSRSITSEGSPCML